MCPTRICRACDVVVTAGRVQRSAYSRNVDFNCRGKLMHARADSTAAVSCCSCSPSQICGIDGCQRQFTRRENLVRHQKVHAERKDHVCDKCEKTFRREWNLFRHKEWCHCEEDEEDEEDDYELQFQGSGLPSEYAIQVCTDFCLCRE